VHAPCLVDERRVAVHARGVDAAQHRRGVRAQADLSSPYNDKVRETM
jgi:hypothetical protein